MKSLFILMVVISGVAFPVAAQLRVLPADGANMDLEELDGDSALICARQNGHAEVVALLESEK
jgi:hypothetical protein